MSHRGIEIVPDASPEVLAALERARSNEDVRFSPNNRRLVLAGCYRNTIAIADVDIEIDGDRPHVTMTKLVDLSSPHLRGPHGVDFLDDDTIIVANRDGDVTVFRLPSDADDPFELSALDALPGGGFEFVDAPGSLVIAGDGGGDIEVLVCNNHGNTMTTHLLQDDPLTVRASSVRLRRWLDFPDGLAVSSDGALVAISNHHSHNVMLFDRSSLHEDSDPSCILRGVSYPHGVRFSADARHLFVADCGGPLIHVFARDGESWQGVRYPTTSVRVMEDDVFREHPRSHLGDGGPKGIDIDRDGQVLAVTSEYQRLAFFDLSAILERSTEHCPDHARQVRYELEILEQARTAEARIAAFTGSMSFQVTKPMRQLKSAWSKLRR